MKVRSIRRLTNDANHNAFTGCRWFKGALYVAWRQGDHHSDPQGKLTVQRSRDGGTHFDTVAVLRGEFDTRDAHLHTDGNRLWVGGFELGHGTIYPGTAWTDNGLEWSPWTRLNGAGTNVMWRPEYFAGKHYCAGYIEKGEWSRVTWFESDDGLKWNSVRVLREGDDQPNECALDFKPDGTAALLVRREHRSRTPLLLTAKPPYDAWDTIELDVPIAGPGVWFVDDVVWFAGRWFLTPQVAHMGVFKVVDGKAVLQMVWPSGPGWDISYMGVARHPLNRHRLHFSYYSDHSAPDDPAVSQWDHPDIYLIDAIFAAEFIMDWQVSTVDTGATLGETIYPDPAASSLSWVPLRSHSLETMATENGFAEATSIIGGQDGVIYFVADLEIGPCDSGSLHLGFDGPVRVWLNGEQVFEGHGSNPARPDNTSLAVRFLHGTNRLAIALDTNGGKACGVFARYERST